MQKHAIYPVGHPLLNDAIDGVMRKLALLLTERQSLSIGIARACLGCWQRWLDRSPCG